MGLYQKLLTLQEEITAVKKTLAIPVKGREYTALKYEDVFQATRGLLKDAGLIYYPMRAEYSKDGSCTTILTEYKVIDVESDESIIVSVVGQGEDPFDKGAGKAQTYADKYFLMRLLRLVATDDPDKTANDTHQELEDETQILFDKCVKYLDASVRMGKKTGAERKEIFQLLESYRNSKKKMMLEQSLKRLEELNEGEGKG